MGARGGTQTEQTVTFMIGYEKLLMEEKSVLCLVGEQFDKTPSIL